MIKDATYMQKVLSNRAPAFLKLVFDSAVPKKNNEQISFASSSNTNHITLRTSHYTDFLLPMFWKPIMDRL